MAKSKFKVTEKDRGFKKFKEQYQQAAKEKPYVKVGILESAGEHKRADGASEALTVAAVGTYQEFGTERIPQRSFMRSTMSDKRQEIGIFIAKLKFKWLEDPLASLALLGMKAQTLIKNKIGEIVDPPNAPSTIAQKKSSKPLIDTGQLRNSIQYEVVKGGKK